MGKQGEILEDEGETEGGAGKELRGKGSGEDKKGKGEARKVSRG